MTLSAHRMTTVAAHLHTALDMCFAHWEAVPGLDLDAAFDAYLEETLPGGDRRRFSFAGLRFLARFRNGHTDFDDAWLRERFGGSFGLFARQIDGDWVVTASRRDDIRTGDAILALDGVPMDEVFAEKRAFIGASSDRAASLVFFSRRILFPERFHLALGDGRTVEIEKAALSKSVLESPGPRLRWTDGRRQMAVLALPSFESGSDETEAIALVDTLPEGAPLILDLRGNGGGDTPLKLLACLMDRPYRGWRETTPATTGLGRAEGDARGTLAFGPVTRQPLAHAFRGAMAILVDGHCCSAAEDFIAPFKDNGRALIVGETTAGSSGQPYVKRLGGGLSFRVGAKRQIFADGSPFEGVGILPDIAVAPDRHDVAAGRDPVLAAALERL